MGEEKEEECSDCENSHSKDEDCSAGDGTGEDGSAGEGSAGDDDGEKKSIVWWRLILAGVITGLLVFAVLYISEQVSLFWGVFLFIIPISAGIVVFTLDDAVLNTFIFFMMLSSFAFALAISVMYVMLTQGYSRTSSLIAFYVIWLIIIGLFFFLFKDKLKNE